MPIRKVRDWGRVSAGQGRNTYEEEVEDREQNADIDDISEVEVGSGLEHPVEQGDQVEEVEDA